MKIMSEKEADSTTLIGTRNPTPIEVGIVPDTTVMTSAHVLATRATAEQIRQVDTHSAINPVINLKKGKSP